MSSFNKKNRSPGWKKGGHWIICDRTGMAIRAEDAKEEWTGSVVAKDVWEPRHPQDFLRAMEDDQSPKGLVRTEPQDSELYGLYIVGDYIDSGYFGLS